jgi:Ca2+-binding RTX toxin-like protein
MPFSMRSKINGEVLCLAGDAQGGVSISSKYKNGELTVTFSSKKDLSVVGTGDLDATIVGGAENDTFDFSGATGCYKFLTGAGNDTVIDGVGNNKFDGGTGLDVFEFNRIESAAVEADVINNYVLADDTIKTHTAPVSVVDGVANQAILTFADGDTVTVNGLGVSAATLNLPTEIIII